MTTFVLDTLAYADTLKAGGFTAQQAETFARTLAEILNPCWLVQDGEADLTRERQP